MRQAFWRIGITVLAVALPGAAYAQSSITGQVTDNTGGILPGVTVEASSPVLIEGSRLAITDGAGRYTIIDLQPGEYVVTFTLVGFSTQIRDGLTLPGDFTLTVDATLAVGALEETVTVSGQAPVVDVQRVARVETLTRETQEAIPTGGSLWNYAALVPGVKPIRPDVGGSRAMQQSWMFGRGASSRQTTLEVDGMTLNTFLDDGRVKPYNNPQMTQEMSVSTNAMNAETGHGGVRINIIPREGGNSFSGSLFGSTTPGALSQDNFNERLRRVGVKEGTTPKLESTYDAQFGFGGPIRQDRIWFFTAGPAVEHQPGSAQRHEPGRLDRRRRQPHPERPGPDHRAGDRHQQMDGVHRQGAPQPVPRVQRPGGPRHRLDERRDHQLLQREHQVDVDPQHPDAAGDRLLLRRTGGPFREPGRHRRRAAGQRLHVHRIALPPRHDDARAGGHAGA